MTLIVCCDDNYGMAFNNRRVSRDIKVIENIEKSVGKQVIRIHPDSVDLFIDSKCVFHRTINYITKATLTEAVFVEYENPAVLFKSVNKVILYKWNRKYPSDVKFPIDELLEDFEVQYCTVFEGNSHPEIKKEVYRRIM